VSKKVPNIQFTLLRNVLIIFLAFCPQEEYAVDCLRELTATMGNDVEENDGNLDREERMAAAEMLCTRYQSPEMLKTLLTVHLRLSGLVFAVFI
jgi:hypothetical protein